MGRISLLARSLVDKVYVSISSKASSPFDERNLNTSDEIMGELKHVTGSTPGKVMLHIQIESSSLTFYLIGDRYA